MNTSSPLFRFFAGLVVAAVAIRVTIELLLPVAPYLLAAVVAVGVFQVVRWWRNRW